jgi:branched-chain amino acid transport system ATP-binding protein
MTLPIAEVSDLVSGYGDVLALHGVSCRIESGKVTALLGSNGAGRTMFLKTVAGLITPRRERIVFDGAEIGDAPSGPRVEQGIMLVPKGRTIFPDMTSRRICASAASRRAPARVAEGLEQIYSMFPRLRERQHQIGGMLSGGDQQMLSLGRDLMARPCLLLLDEPTLGLAPLMAQTIFEKIKELKASGLTIVIAEQDVRRTLELADWAYVLESGRSVMDGAGTDLLTDTRIRAAYLGI